MDKLTVHTLEGAASPISHYRSTLVTCDDIVFLYGGFDDFDELDSKVYLFDTGSMTWETVDTSKGVYREGHSAVYIGNGNVLIFGGVTEDEFHHEVKEKQSNSVMLIYNVRSKTWISPPDFALTNAPSNRSRHASCLSPDGSKLYISGGLLDSNVTDQLFIYDFTVGDWEGPYKFTSRFDHFITIYGDKLFIFGGLNANMNHVMDKVSFFDLNDHSQGEITIFHEQSNVNTFDFRAYQHYYQNTLLDGIQINVSISVDGAILNINYYNLQQLKFVNLLNVNDAEHNHFYSWKNCIICKNDILIFGSADEEHLDIVLQIDMNELGLVNKNLGHSLNKNLVSLFNSGEFTDFEIYCFATNSIKEKNLEDPDSMHDRINHIMTNDLDDENFTKISVHKTVLLARWPHFKRLIESGMSEAKTNKMFIPELHTWTNALIYYLYADNIDFVENSVVSSFSLIDYSGLLILSNFYELDELRSLVLIEIHNHLNRFLGVLSDDDINSILNVWINLFISNEEVLINKLTEILKRNWSKIIISDAFSHLPKPAMVKLVQNCTSEETPSSTPKKVIRLSISNDSLSSLSSPDRDCNSPFYSSLRFDKTEELSSTLPSLQFLSGLLNNSTS